MNPIPTKQHQYRLYNANTRPDLWKALKEDTNHPLNTAWPLFLDQDTCFQQYFAKLSKYKALSEFQFAIVELDETDRA